MYSFSLGGMSSTLHGNNGNIFGMERISRISSNILKEDSKVLYLFGVSTALGHFYTATSRHSLEHATIRKHQLHTREVCKANCAGAVSDTFRYNLYRHLRK